MSCPASWAARPRWTRASSRPVCGCRANPTSTPRRASKRPRCSVTRRSSPQARASPARWSARASPSVAARGCCAPWCTTARSSPTKPSPSTPSSASGRSSGRVPSPPTTPSSAPTPRSMPVRAPRGRASDAPNPTVPNHRPSRRRGDPVRVMVTGGAGFIGSTLVDRLLAEGCDVDAIDDLSSGVLANLTEARAQRNRKFSFHRLDIRSPQLGDLVGHRRPEVIFHLAAQPDVRVSVAKPLFDAEVNVLGSLNVCEAALTAGTRKVVFAGSGGTLYGVPESLPVRESHPQRPISPYGVSKKAAGDYLHYYREVRGLEYTELALGNVYGPRQDPNGEAGVVSIFAGRMLAGRQPTVYGDGAQTRDYVFVDDVVDAFVRATEKGGGLLMNIGTGVETSVLDLYDAIAGAVGYAEPPNRAPARAGELERSALDPGRAAIHLGWKPWTPLDEGLGLTVDWFRDA